MGDTIAVGEAKTELDKQQKVVSLFRFIEGLNKLKQKVGKRALNYRDYPWFFDISSIPDDPNHIKIYYRDRVEEECTEDTSDVLLSVHKPKFENCPVPGPSLENWLEPGWDDYRKKPKVKEFLLQPLKNWTRAKRNSSEYAYRVDEKRQTYKEAFNDSEERLMSFLNGEKSAMNGFYARWNLKRREISFLLYIRLASTWNVNLKRWNW